MSRKAVKLALKTVKVRNAAGSPAEYQYWELRWYDPKSGKHLAESLGRADDPRARNYITKTEAKRRRVLKEAQFDKRPGRRGEQITLAEWIALYKKQRMADHVKPRTIEAEGFSCRLLEGYFDPDTALASITRADARAFSAALAAGELAEVNEGTRPFRCGPQTLAKHLRQIAAIFNRAVDDEHIEGNPFARMKKPRVAADEDWDYVSSEMFWALYEVVPAEWKKLLALGRLAALTRGDALLLEWSQVDMDKREIRIRRGKTGVEQHAPIDQNLFKLLKAWYAERSSIRITGDRLVDEREVYLGNIGRDVDRWCKAAGISFYGKPLHTLRKSCILDWARIQPSAQVLKLWAGHANIKTTLQFYDKARAEDMAVGKGRLIKAASKRGAKTGAKAGEGEGAGADKVAKNKADSAHPAAG